MHHRHLQRAARHVTHRLTLATRQLPTAKRQRDVAALDERKYTKEGSSRTKAENDALRDDILPLAAVACTSAQHAPVPTGKNPPPPPRMDNAASPELADSAQRDYFALKRVKTMQSL